MGYIILTPNYDELPDLYSGNTLIVVDNNGHLIYKTETREVYLDVTSLSGLTDVNINNITSNQILKYDGNKWVNTSYTEGVSEQWVSNNFLSASTTISDLSGYTINEINANFLSISGGTIYGNIIPDVDGIRSLGNSAYTWKDIYVSGGTIYLNNIPLTTNGDKLIWSGSSVIVKNSIDDITIKYDDNNNVIYVPEATNTTLGSTKVASSTEIYKKQSSKVVKAEDLNPFVYTVLISFEESDWDYNSGVSVLNLTLGAHYNHNRISAILVLNEQNEEVETLKQITSNTNDTVVTIKINGYGFNGSVRLSVFGTYIE